MKQFSFGEGIKQKSNGEGFGGGIPYGDRCNSGHLDDSGYGDGSGDDYDYCIGNGCGSLKEMGYGYGNDVGSGRSEN